MSAGEADALGQPRFTAARVRLPPTCSACASRGSTTRQHARSDAAVPDRRAAAAPRSTCRSRRPTAPDYHYDGDGGIALSSPLRRAAFAARFGDVRLLLTETVTDRSRIMLRRDVQRAAAHAGAVPATGTRTRRPWCRRAGAVPVPRLHDEQPLPLLGAGAHRRPPRELPARFGVRRRRRVQRPGQRLRRRRGRADPARVARRVPGPVPARSRGCRTSCARTCATRAALFDGAGRAYATYHAGEPTAFWNGADAWQRPQQLAGPVEDAGEIHFPDPADVDADERRETGLTPSAGMDSRYLLARLPGDAARALHARHAVHAARPRRTSSATWPARSTPPAGRELVAAEPAARPAHDSARRRRLAGSSPARR